MIKICHIRGTSEYWKHLDLPRISGCPSEENRDLMYKCWKEYFNISYQEFKLHIREATINYIKELNEFDVILYNNEMYREFLKNNKIDNMMLYSQDDDDILYFIPNDISPGMNIYNYSCIDITGTKRIEYELDDNFLTFLPEKIQSNHAIYFVLNQPEFVQNIKSYGYIRAHTIYDSYKEHLIENNVHISYHDYFFTTQFYHLTSLSLWKNIAGVSKASRHVREQFFDEEQFNKNCIFKIFDYYIDFMKNFNIPKQLNDIKFKKGAELITTFKNLYINVSTL